MKYEFIKYFISVIILMVIQRLFNCYVYETDGKSVLFGIALFGITFIIHMICDTIMIEHQSRNYRKEFEKMLQDWEDSYRE